MYEMLYDAQLSTGECEHALYLGCKECKKCKVDEYEELLEKHEEEEQKFLEQQFNEWEEEEQRNNKYLFKKNYTGIPLNRWSRIIIEISEFCNNIDKETRIVDAHYYGETYVNYGVLIVIKDNDKYWLEDIYF